MDKKQEFFALCDAKVAALPPDVAIEFTKEETAQTLEYFGISRNELTDWDKEYCLLRGYKHEPYTVSN